MQFTTSLTLFAAFMAPVLAMPAVPNAPIVMLEVRPALSLGEKEILTVPSKERQCAPIGSMCTNEIPCCTSLCITPNTIC